jgi:hypothetical protein
VIKSRYTYFTVSDLKSQIWDSKIWSRVRRDSDRRKTTLARTSSIYKRQTHPLVREGALGKQVRNCLRIINIWSWAPDGARHKDLLIDWPSVAMWLNKPSKRSKSEDRDNSTAEGGDLHTFRPEPTSGRELTSSTQIMKMRIFATLDKANRDTGNTRGLNLAAVNHTTVQVTRLLFQQELLIIGMICCTEPELKEALYMLYIHTFNRGTR